MKIIPKNQLEELRARSDIVEVIGGYLRLQRAGSAFKALCPFHKEKTPSFHVNPARQIFHCFGCGAGGDVFRFVVQHQGVDFMTAVRILAQRAGLAIELEEDGAEKKSEREVLFAVLQATADFYHRVLMEHATAAEARDYVRSRDLETAAQTFHFGYAPAQPDAMLKFAEARKFDPSLLETAGILARAEGRAGWYDRFHGRLIIPIADELGRVIGFTGRVLPSDASPAKYVNSPETALFRKSRVLFAFDRARRAIVRSRCAILCEGQIDVIRCHLAGLENAVAAQGTAVTEEHAHLLRRYADEVVLMLDADAAGQSAALRSAETLLSAELSMRVATLPPGEDPDSLIRRAGAAAVERVVANAVSVIRFLVDVREAQGEMADEAGVRRTARAALDLIAASPAPTQRELMLREAAARLRLSESALREQMRRRPRRPLFRGTDDDRGSAAPRPPHPPEETGALGVALKHPDTWPLFQRHLPERLLTDPACVRIYRVLLATPPEEWTARLFAPEVDAEAASLASELLAAPEMVRGETYAPETAAKDYLRALWRNELQRQRNRLLRATHPGPDQEQKINLLCHHIGLLTMEWDDAEAVMELHEDE